MVRRVDADPKALLVLWCSQSGLPAPAFVACRLAGGIVEVAGSVALDHGRYVRASHRAAHEYEAELEVSRDLFVQVQAMAGPIVLPDVVPRRRETAPERIARRAAEGSGQERANALQHEAQIAHACTAREALEGEARRQGAFTCITAHRSDHRRWTAEGLWQVGSAQTTSGPFTASTRQAAEAKVVAHLLRLCADSEAGGHLSPPP